MNFDDQDMYHRAQVATMSKFYKDAMRHAKHHVAVQGNWAPVFNNAPTPVQPARQIIDIYDTQLQRRIGCNVLHSSDVLWNNRNFRYEIKGYPQLRVICSKHDTAVNADEVSTDADGYINDARCSFHSKSRYMEMSPAPNAVPVAIIKTPVVAAPDPPVCWERYSGIECQCPKTHRLPGSRR